jgi:hypothetical protein
MIQGEALGHSTATMWGLGFCLRCEQHNWIPVSLLRTPMTTTNSVIPVLDTGIQDYVVT